MSESSSPHPYESVIEGLERQARYLRRDNIKRSHLEGFAAHLRGKIGLAMSTRQSNKSRSHGTVQNGNNRVSDISQSPRGIDDMIASVLAKAFPEHRDNLSYQVSNLRRNPIEFEGEYATLVLENVHKFKIFAKVVRWIAGEPSDDISENIKALNQFLGKSAWAFVSGNTLIAPDSGEKFNLDSAGIDSEILQIAISHVVKPFAIFDNEDPEDSCFDLNQRSMPPAILDQLGDISNLSNIKIIDRILRLEFAI